MRRTEERGRTTIGVYIVTFFLNAKGFLPVVLQNSLNSSPLSVRECGVFLLCGWGPQWPHYHALLTPKPPQSSPIVKGSMSASAYGMSWVHKRKGRPKAQAEEKSVQQAHLNKPENVNSRSLCPLY